MTRFIARQSSLLLTLTVILFAGLLMRSPGLAAVTPAHSIAVKLEDYHFIPDSITVLTGETVQLELTNTDSMTPHNFTLKAEAAGLDVDVDVSAGKTEFIDITPLAPGRYKFYCNKKLLFFKSHSERGMEGTLVVMPTNPE